MTDLFPDETIAQSPYSPGPTENSELLFRFVLFPDHVGEDGLLSPGFVRIDDLQKCERGWSVDRLKHVETDHVVQNVTAHLKRHPERKCMGVARVHCYRLRSLVDVCGTRLLKLIDNGIETNPAHAIVLCSHKFCRSRVMKIRGEVLDVLRFARLGNTVFDC